MRLPWPFRRAERADAAPAPEAPAPAEPARRSVRFDDWMNQITQVGMAGRDPRMQTTFYADVIPEQIATDIVRGDHIAARVVNKPIDEMFRPGFDLKIVEQDDARGADGARAGTDERPAEKLRKDVVSEWKRLKVMKALRKALKWERKDGGSAILLGINDGSATMAAPVNWKAGRFKFDWIRVLRARDLQPVAYYEDPKGEKFDEPMIWRINGTSRNGRMMVATETLIHESRLLIFEGIKVTDEPLNGQLPGFGDSVLNRFFRVLRRYASSLDSAETLVGSFAEPVWKKEGLAEILADDKDGSFKAYVAAMAYAKSALRVALIDAKDEYSRLTTPVTGLPELIGEFKSELQAAADMPLPVLFGDVVGGLGDQSEGPLRGWYDHLATLREEIAFEPLQYMTRAIFHALGGKEPADWSIEGRPFWQLSAKEQADIDKLDADTDVALVGATVITSRDVANREKWQLRYGLEPVDSTADVEIPDDVREVDGESSAGADADASIVDSKAPPSPAMMSVLLGIQERAVKAAIPRAQLVAAVMIGLGVDKAIAETLVPQPDATPRPDEAKPPVPPVAQGSMSTKAASPGRIDGSPDQPRAEDGRWTSAGSAGGSPSGGSPGGDGAGSATRQSKAVKAIASHPALHRDLERIRAEQGDEAAASAKRDLEKTLEQDPNSAERTLALLDVAQHEHETGVRIERFTKPPPTTEGYDDSNWHELMAKGAAHAAEERAHYERIAKQRPHDPGPPEEPHESAGDEEWTAHEAATDAYHDSPAGIVREARAKVLEYQADDLENAPGLDDHPASRRVERLTEIADEAKERISDAKSTMRNHKREVAQLEKAIAKGGDDADDLRDQLADLKTEAARSERAIPKAERTIATVKKKMVEAKAARATARKEASRKVSAARNIADKASDGWIGLDEAESRMAKLLSTGVPAADDIEDDIDEEDEP